MATGERDLPPHLIFGLRGALYAVDAAAVREILPFLELSAMEEMPGHILGVANLRGKIVPIMDLNLRFGRAPAPYRASDCIVVLDWDEATVGIVVNEVREVRQILPGQVEWKGGARRSALGARLAATAEDNSPGAELSLPAQFVAGLAKLDEHVVMLLDLERLLRLPDGMPESAERGRVASGSARQALDIEATPEERVLLRERARALAKPPARDDFAGLEPVAVTRLGGEFFGFELESVREFVTVRSIAPVPCCPRHIVGQVNLRGDIVTLVDLRPALRVPAEPSATRLMVLVEIDELRFGVSVDEVLEIVPLHRSEIGAVPAAQQQRAGEYLKGAVPYQGKMLGILDLPRLVAEGSLIVDEAV